ncbi:MAG: hypothetical protein JXB26_11440 [Candidatus Aminicenantes bacterium]|nr:hypothetical protein [Candidatus Aminicenantes bacterium]
MFNHRIRRSFLFVVASAVFLLFMGSFVVSGLDQSPQQALDEEYTRLIRESTTRPEFSSPLVNFLPKKDGVPTPKDILGYIAGAPGKLTYYEAILKYMSSLADASERVDVLPIGKTSEGREMVIVVISENGTMKRLDEHKNLLARLADPRIVKTEAEAEEIISRVKPVYWLIQNLHSSESGSAEACMELAYRLAVEESPMIKRIRNNLIVLITPSAEPDGHDKHTDWYYKVNADVKEREKITYVPYWGRYDYHDNNRDMITMSQPEMKNITEAFFEWHPVILQDNHESGFLFYVSSSNGPSNFHPSLGSDINLMAWFEVSQMTGYGMPGVYTHDFGNTMWSPNFMASVAASHHALFHFYETLGNGVGQTFEREMPERSRKETWYRPIAPPEKFLWSMRNNVNYQQTGDILAFYAFASNKELFLKNFWKRGFDSYMEGQKNFPYAFIIPSGQKDPLDTAELVNVLLEQRIEVHQLVSDIKINEGEFSAGSYIVRMDQPYRNLAVMLLGIQEYPQGPDIRRVYDDAGWTLGLHMDVKTIEVKDKAVFEAKVNPVKNPVKPVGGVRGGKAEGAYVFNHGTINALLSVRMRLGSFHALATEEAFSVKDKKFDAGSIIFPVEKTDPEIHKAVGEVCREWGLSAFALKKMPEVKTHELKVPRIAIFHTWFSTQDDGWVRLAFDQLKVPYAYIDKDDLRRGDLNDRFDAILFGNCFGRTGGDIINGLDPELHGPLSYVRTDQFKHLGTPDSNEDITGGMGLEGLIQLRDFVRQGGLLILIQNPIRVVLDFGLVRGLREARPEAGFINPGSLLRGEVVNHAHPAVYGTNDFPVIFHRQSGPILSVPKDLEKYIVLKYATKEKLCLSGMVVKEKTLKGKAAIMDVPVGEGHIVMFTFNPMWRATSRGNYMFVFNTLLNFKNLDVPLPEKVETKKTG